MASSHVVGNLAEVWRKLIWNLANYGSVVSPRGLATREILGVQLHIEDYSKNIIVSESRNLNYKFMIAEWLWIHEGHNDVSSIAAFNKEYFKLTDDGDILNGAYGPHWVKQQAYIVRALQKDPMTRQAVMTLWKTNPEPSKDIPCTVSIQFIQRNGFLNVIVNMRSSDVWLGIPYDVFVFSQMGNWVAEQLGYIRGDLILQLGSSHMYEHDVKKAEPILRVDDEPTLLKSPMLTTPKEGYTDSILKPKAERAFGLEEPWRTYAEILGRPRTEAFANLEALQRYE